MANGQNPWKYEPNVGLATIVCIIFIFLTTLHGYQLLRTKTWYFIAFWIGGVLECIGYLTRIWSAKQKPDYSTGPYAISQIMVLIAPSLFAASMYMELGRIIRLVGGEAYSIVRVSRLTKIFVIGDVIAFLAQAGGAALLSSDSVSTSNTGQKILIVGLVIQIIFFALFVVVSLVFHMRIAGKATEKMMQYPSMPWKKHLVNIYVASTLVLVRCIFRLIEYAAGEDGYLLTNEWPNYVFDTLLMIIVMIAFNVIHPSEVKALLNGNGRAVRKIVKTHFISLPGLEGNADDAAKEANGHHMEQFSSRV